MISIFDKPKEEEVTLRLTKSQKCMDKLKNELKNLQNCSGFVPLQNIKKSAPTSENFVKRSNELVQNQRDTFKRNLLLQNDLANLKDTVYTKNHELGLDKILTRSTLVNSYIKLLQQLVKSMEGSYKYTSDELQGLFTKQDSESVSMYNNTVINHAAFDSNQIKDELATLLIEADNLEDKRDGLNARHKITLKPSTITIDFLGLHMD